MDEQKTFTERVLAVQASLKAPKDKSNDFGHYKYRSAESILAAVKPILFENGLVLTISDEMVIVGNRIYVKATATVTDGKEKQSTTAFAREEESKKGMDASQVTGAASSYARKYALNGLFAIDDTRDADALNTSPAYTEQVVPQEIKDTADMVKNDINIAPDIDSVKKIWMMYKATFAQYKDIYTEIKNLVIQKGQALKTA